MDIDDLLAEVSADSVPRETRDLQELTRAWVAERVAPELLPYPEMLMEMVLGRIRKQVCTDLLSNWCGDVNCAEVRLDLRSTRCSGE
jgi:GINS complex subunit 4